MKRSSGFSFIEVILALLIGSIISIMVYQVFAQTVRVTDRMSGRIDEYGDTFITLTQLERDLMGLVLLPESDIKKTGTTNPASENQSGASIQAGQEIEGSEREERIPFECVVREGKLISLAFVTTNALPSVDAVGSRLVRVRYFIEVQRDDPALMQLMREEAPYPFQKQTALEQRAYPLLSHLESLEITCYLTVRKGESDQEVKLKEWGTDQQKEKYPAAPEFITISGVYRTRTTQEQIPFTYSISIPAAKLAVYDYYKKEEKQKKEQAQKQVNQVMPAGAA